jgi:AhpD family alkylhydroperoxidase
VTTEFLPGPYQSFLDRYPAIHEAYESLSGECHSAGPLDERTRRLVKLAVAVGAESPGAVMSHTRKALDAGITADEIRHVVLLAFTTAGFPAMIAAMSWVDEVLAHRAGGTP